MTPHSDAPAADEPAQPPAEDDLADIATGLHTLLQLAEETVATAESLTGGMVAEVLTDAPGASDTFRGGIVAYATELKVEILGVTQECVDTEGVVSAACAAAMADGARRVTGATYAVSTTGVAGPTEQEGKPVGTVYVGVSGPESTDVDELVLPGERDEVRRRATGAALSALAARLSVRPGEETAVR